MKIGEFSQKFNVTVATVRYYINSGLLAPEKNGFQYNFTENDCREMEIICSMKSAGFKLNELNKYLSLYRFYNKDDYILYEKLIEFLNIKKESLHHESMLINSCIQAIDKKIDQIESSSVYISGKSGCPDRQTDAALPGFPLSAVRLLYCPCCQTKLTMSDVKIYEDYIISGKLSCQCGYTTSINNGILITDNLTDLDNDYSFLDSYFGRENLVTNEDGMMLMAMKDHSNEYLTNLHRSGLWVHKELGSFNLHGKTILFPDMACQYLYSHYEGADSGDNTFIITALTERTIRAMRQHIANACPKLNAVYIINQDGRLPLRNSCIDVVIDFMGSTNLGFFIEKHYFDMIAGYLSEDAVIAGVVEYYPVNSPSLSRISRLYSNASADVFTEEFVESALERNGFHIDNTEIISEGYHPGRFFEYHIAGDKRTNMVYIAQRD